MHPDTPGAFRRLGRTRCGPVARPVCAWTASCSCVAFRAPPLPRRRSRAACSSFPSSRPTGLAATKAWHRARPAAFGAARARRAAQRLASPACHAPFRGPAARPLFDHTAGSLSILALVSFLTRVLWGSERLHRPGAPDRHLAFRSLVAKSVAF